MKPIAQRDPYKLGLIAIAALGLLVGVVVLLSVVKFGVNNYTAYLEQTAGLRPGEDVQVAGVPVGQVTGIKLDGDRVKVSFNLDKDITLGSDTSAAVKVATLLGTHYLQVKPEGGGELADGTIQMDHTSVPYNLQDILDQGSKNLGELDADKLAQALTAMSDAIKGSGSEVGPALQGVTRLSTMISTRSDQSRELLGAARKVTQELDASSQDIIALMQQTDLVVSEVTARREAIHRLLVESTRLTGNLVSIINATKGDIQPALKNFDSAIAALKAEDQKLQQVLSVMAPAVRYVTNATGQGPWADLFLHDPGLEANDVACKGGC